MNDATSVEQITNTKVLTALFAVSKLNDVRFALLANRPHAGDLATAARLLDIDLEMLRALEYCLLIEEHPVIVEMYDRTQRIAEETAKLVRVIEAQEMMQAAVFESALVTIH